ncbi:MAG: glycosyltransferase [Candidatus Aegiribacteria sp.]|nr:glycosyltransferase [Candidatus Aegiribacteria sp.]
MINSIDVSVIIPAYNEENRIGTFLDKLVTYCGNSVLIYEVIVVDDCSTDDTIGIIAQYEDQFEHFHLLRSKRNSGKGYSVKRGLFKAQGDICLFMDADGSVEPDEIEKNLEYIRNNGYDIFIGSRVLRNSDQVLVTRWYREFMGKVFNFFVRLFLFRDICDTQCGFKIFRREVIRPVFSRVHIDGFGFDLELLYLAQRMGYRIKECPVSWHHVDGAKVRLLWDSIGMLFNILQVRSRHRTSFLKAAGCLKSDEYRYMYEVENSHWWFVSRRNLMIELIIPFNMKTPEILDVGCGTGGNMKALNKIGHACGTDLSDRAVEFCRINGLDNVIECGIEEVPLKNRSFDIVVCLDVLEHLDNPSAGLAELRRVLKDDGRIIVTVPAFSSLWSQHDVALGHLRRYRRRTLKRLVEDSGFEVLKMSHLYFLSFFFVAPFRLFRRFFIEGSKVKSDTTSLPPRLLNSLLLRIFTAEAHFSSKFGLPFGTTIYAVIRKHED